MTTEERFHLHEQMLASIERNLGALVEAQQRTERQVGTLAQATDRILGMLQEVIRHQQWADQRVDRSEERMDRLTESQQRLADTLQRFLDSQMGRNGGN